MKLNKAREMLIEEFKKCLTEDETLWKKGWKVEQMNNPNTGTQYHGVNRLLLNAIAVRREYADNRWLTFNQIKEKGYSLKNAKGHGVPIEYWACYNMVSKKTVSFSEADRLIEEGEYKEGDFRPYPKTYIVFNGDLIEGLPKMEEKISLIDTNDRAKKVLDNYLKNTKVGLIETSIDKACYVPSTDKIHIPKSYYFETREEYLLTLAHEIAHSTGHESRLNRDLNGRFGSKEYAKEELRAEIASAFLNESLGVVKEKIDIQNNKAYVQSWLEVLNKEPNFLFKAISDAEKISDFVLEKGEYEKVYINELTNEEILQKFDTLLHDCDFKIYLNENNKLQLYDNQRANLGNIEYEKFENAIQIIDRLDIYIYDCYIRTIEEKLEDLGVENCNQMNFNELINKSMDLIKSGEMSKEYMGDIEMIQFIDNAPQYECLNDIETIKSIDNVIEIHQSNNNEKQLEDDNELEELSV